MIHERKFNVTHQEMFKECVNRIPSLKKSTCPIVTDKEKAITKAINSEMPNLTLFYCWNHIFKDIRTWCRKHGAPSSDITIYVNDVKELFHLSTADSYKKKLVEFKTKWDAAFEQYYMHDIHPDVGLSVGRWALEENNPYIGVTNNQSEGLNRYFLCGKI